MNNPVGRRTKRTMSMGSKRVTPKRAPLSMRRKIYGPAEVITPVADNPISRLRFPDSLDGEKFAAAAKEASLSHLNVLLRGGVGDGIVVTVNSVCLARSGAEMIVSLSRDGRKLVVQGRAIIMEHGQSGRALPIIQNVQTGKIMEHFKEVKMSKMLSRVGSLSSAIIGAAHIVSAADIARRLQQVEAKIDLLIAYRHIDQLAKLERIYSAAKELLASPLGQYERGEVWRLRHDLRELRVSWRRQFEHHLNLIEDPQEAGALHRLFTRRKTTDQKIQSKITDGEINVALIEYSMRLDHLLATLGGTLSKFELSLEDELCNLEDLAILLKSKADLISGKFQEVTVEPTMRAMTAFNQSYRDLLARRTLTAA